MDEILKIEDEISAALAAGDAAAVASHYTEDAVLMPPFRRPIEGRAAIQAFYEEGLARVSIQINTQVTELEVAGDWAFLRGTFRQTLRPKKGGGKGMENTGKYIVIARKDSDGRWRFARDIFNSDAFPQAGGCAGILLAPARKMFGG